MKEFYVNRLGLDLVSEEEGRQEEGRHVFLKAGKSMLLVFNPEKTRLAANDIFPVQALTFNSLGLDTSSSSKFVPRFTSVFFSDTVIITASVGSF
jgi:hypothetical protein